MYNALVTALRACGVPFAENGWANAPQTGSYGVITLDGDADTVWADGQLQEEAVEGTIDLYCRDKSLSDLQLVQAVLTAQGVSWRWNSTQYEPARRIMHYELVIQLETLKDGTDDD